MSKAGRPSRSGFKKKGDRQKGKKQKSRRDLEDLYYAAVERDKKEKQNLKKVHRQVYSSSIPDATHDAAECAEVSHFGLSESLGVASKFAAPLDRLLSLFNAGDKEDAASLENIEEEEEEEGEEPTDEEWGEQATVGDDENCAPAPCDGRDLTSSHSESNKSLLDSASAVPRYASEEMGDDIDACLTGEKPVDFPDLEDEEGPMSDDDTHAGADDSSQHWKGNDFLSFMTYLPEVSHPIDTKERHQLVLPGFSPYMCTNPKHVFTCTQDLSSEPLDFSAKGPVLRSSLSCIPEKIWKRWETHVFPKIREEEGFWHSHGCRMEALEVVCEPTQTLPYSSGVAASTAFFYVSKYIDVLLSTETFLTSPFLRGIAALHIASHMHKTRRYIERNNEALKKCIEKQSQLEKQCVQSSKKNSKKQCTSKSLKLTTSIVDKTGDDRFRDQGFTHPRVLIVTPTRHSAKVYIEMLLQLFPNVKQVRYRNRFVAEFGAEDCDTPEEKQKTESGEALLDKGKPCAFADIFRGNSADNFRMGLRLHRSGVTLYAPFYHSDIIIASPLGLQLIIGSEGDENSKCDYDFLSSLEIVVVDRADVLKMQNWENVKRLFQVLNTKPLQWRGDCDIRRLREVYSEGLARRLRQTIIFSNGRFPELNALFSTETGDTEGTSLKQRFLCENFRGCVRLFRKSTDAVLRHARNLVGKQLFMSIPCTSPPDIHEALLKFFANQFPPSFLNTHSSNRILLVVPTYIEYLRLRRILKTSKNVAADPRDLRRFRSCHEYSSNAMLTKSRQMFRSGEVNLLIVTERWLFYRRYAIKGADHVVFYQPPQYPEIYIDCISHLNAPAASIILTLFTVFHALECERYMGTQRTQSLMQCPSEVPKVFVFE